jgi:hypothetical protein
VIGSFPGRSNHKSNHFLKMSIASTWRHALYIVLLSSSCGQNTMPSGSNETFTSVSGGGQSIISTNNNGNTQTIVNGQLVENSTTNPLSSGNSIVSSTVNGVNRTFVNGKLIGEPSPQKAQILPSPSNINLSGGSSIISTNNNGHSQTFINGKLAQSSSIPSPQTGTSIVSSSVNGINKTFVNGQLMDMSAPVGLSPSGKSVSSIRTSGGGSSVVTMNNNGDSKTFVNGNLVESSSMPPIGMGRNAPPTSLPQMSKGKGGKGKGKGDKKLKQMAQSLPQNSMSQGRQPQGTIAPLPSGSREKI